MTGTMNTFNVGDILVSTVQWECNYGVTFYQVVKVNKATLIIRMIGYKEINFGPVPNSGMYAGEVVPVKDSFKGDTMSVKYSGESITIRKGVYASKWGGKPEKIQYD